MEGKTLVALMCCLAMTVVGLSVVTTIEAVEFAPQPGVNILEMTAATNGVSKIHNVNVYETDEAAVPPDPGSLCYDDELYSTELTSVESLKVGALTAGTICFALIGGVWSLRGG